MKLFLIEKILHKLKMNKVQFQIDATQDKNVTNYKRGKRKS